VPLNDAKDQKVKAPLVLRQVLLDERTSVGYCRNPGEGCERSRKADFERSSGICILFLFYSSLNSFLVGDEVMQLFLSFPK
jgi:hypothetical protein